MLRSQRVTDKKILSELKKPQLMRGTEHGTSLKDPAK